MKNIIIGTAGHIDHGKTSLIKALTGRNTDRFKEEQERGITIDLGFTYFDLSQDERVGIIDVPGHEKFINNMVAGVVGMDLVMLVISAEEGIMPQTREHMDILAQLGIEKSIIVLNKCDLVDKDWLELMEEEIKEELKDTFLVGAPVIGVSAFTGEGIPELKELISRMTREEVEPKDIRTIARLPIDRAFSISGFGTVITGTLVSGSISKESTLQMYPSGKECKIRSIQVHGESVDSCQAGQRVAINISNIKKEEVSRGCVLAPIGNMKNTSLLDVKLEVSKSCKRILTNHTRLHLFTGTSEILCRAVLLGDEELKAGESGYAQLRLEEEIAIRRGDRFVIRFYSPMETIGGGIVLEPNPSKKKRFKPEVLEELKCKEAGDSKDVCEMHIKSATETMITAAEIAKITAMKVDEVIEDLKELESRNTIKLFHTKKDVFAWHCVDLEEMNLKILNHLKAFHLENIYKYGENKAKLHMEFMKKLKPNVFDMYMEYLCEIQLIDRKNEFVKEINFEIKKDTKYIQLQDKLLQMFDEAKYDFIKISTIELTSQEDMIIEDILNVLLEEDIIVKVVDGIYTTTELMNNGVAKIQEVLDKENLITIASVRDLLDTSRKSAKPIFEYLDGIKVTKRNGTESERVSYK